MCRWWIAGNILGWRGFCVGILVYNKFYGNSGEISRRQHLFTNSRKVFEVGRWMGGLSEIKGNAFGLREFPYMNLLNFQSF